MPSYRTLRLALIMIFVAVFSTALAQKGFIQVRAEPGIRVFLDDEFVGVTNADDGGLILEDVSVGQRRLRFVREGFVPQDATVNVAAGRVLLYEVGSLLPRVEITQEGDEEAAELQLKTGSVVVQCLPIECVVDIPAANISNVRKTQDRLVARMVPVGSYSGRLSVGATVLPVSFEVCPGDTVSLFGTFVGSSRGVQVTSEGGYAPGCEILPRPASHANISNVRLGVASEGSRLVSFDISWDESWRGPDRPSWVAASDNWDAAWVFAKYRVDGGAWQHATLASSGHVVPSGAVVDVPSDRVGAFIYRSSSGYGTFTANGVGLVWDVAADGVPVGASVEVQPFAIEMVYVPEGSFSVGSGGSSTGEFRAGGTSNTPFVVSSQSSIALGDGSGQLMWSEEQESGSPSGSTRASFPTGFGAFYVMKYQITQGQYAAFLNTLTQAQADARKHTEPDYRYAITGSSVGSYATSLPFVAMNYLSWADGAAFADWAGLRPMTELEFEKAARGPLNPVPDEFAWGSTSITQVTGLASAGTVSETPLPASANAQYGNWEGSPRGPVRVGSFTTPDRSRWDAGAAYYGALELSGNLWERAVTVGNAEGRAFAGTHGDGSLDAGGNANVVSWPGSDAGGAGVHGGAWSVGDESLQISARNSAAAVFAPRHFTVGWRGARSAP